MLMKPKQTKDCFSGIDSRTKEAIERLLYSILTQTPEESQEAQELIIRNQSQLFACYILDRLTKELQAGKVSSDSFPAVLTILANLKPLLWSSDLMGFDETVRETFFHDLMLLESVWEEFFDAKKISELEPAARTFFCYMYTMLLGYSNDLLLIYANYPFDSPVHIKCGFCGNDIHSVLVNPEGMDHNNCSTVIPREYLQEADGLYPDSAAELSEQSRVSESETVEGIGECDWNEWDFFTNHMRFYTACKETYLSGIFRYLYGTHSCTVCEKDECVMDSCRNWFYQEQKTFQEPSEELIVWLLERAKRCEGEIKENTAKQGIYFGKFLLKMAIWYEKSRSSQDLRLIYDSIYKLYDGVPGRDMPVYIKKTQYLLRQLKKTPWKTLLAKTYYLLSRDFTADIDEDWNRYDLSFQAMEKAVQLFSETREQNPTEYRNSVLAFAITVAESEEGSVETAERLLLEWIEREQEKEQPDTWNIGEAYNKLAYLFAERAGDYEKAYQYYDLYLEEAKRTYGEDSDYVADCLDELAEYHEAAKDLYGACQLREKALEINLREMGKMYLLPPIFKGIALTAAKMVKAIDENDKYLRVMSVVDSYMELADLYSEINRYEKGLICCQKAAALLEWEFKGRPKVPKLVRTHISMGNLYDKMGKGRLAEKEYRLAAALCRSIIKESPFEEDVDECRDMLEELE